MPSPQFTGPLPPAGQQFCIMCAADWKARAITLCHERNISLDTSAVIDLAQLMAGQPDPAIGVAETTMVLPAPITTGGSQMVVMGLACWSHLTAIKVMDSSLAVGGPGPFAGAVDLGQRHG